MNVEDLPSPLAIACARATPSERPPPERSRECATAFLEMACLRMLSEAATRPESMPFTVESAMRLTLLDPLGAEGWLDLYAALEHSGMDELLDWPTELPAPIRSALAELGASSVLEWLEKAVHAPDPPSSVAQTVLGLGHTARALTAMPPWWIRSCQVTQGGYEVEGRRLVGTRWPEVVRIAAPIAVPTGLCFWDRVGTPVPIPEWLASWDADDASMRIIGGRDGSRYLWRGTRRLKEVVFGDGPPAGLPPFLREPTFATPAGAERFDPNAQTTAIPRSEPADRRQDTAKAVTRVATPPAGTNTPSLPGSVLARRVVAGPDMMRWTELSPTREVTLGRQADLASFPLHHHQVSRRHATVKVDPDGVVLLQDLGSTNGTQVYSPVPGLPPRTLRAEEGSVHPGDTIGLGPVLARVEWLTQERIARLDTVAKLRDDTERRDPATWLLRPQALKSTLPESLHATFRDGGASDGPPLLGLLLYVDRLAALHAQFGERVADRAFRDVARILQFEVSSELDGPIASAAESLVRVGYGELLLPVVGVDEAVVHHEAERLVTLIANHPFEAPVERLTLTAAVVPKAPVISAADWLKQARRVLQDGRSRHGRSHVYR
ncbi:MAG: FHA domain-containing protein [Myxococcales bacterium]|nr:FHA domain-containing protein [Myxococcales bacterium]